MRADTWGPIGAAVAAACCLGIAPVVTALSALGLGFVLDDRILIPLLVLLLGATAWQLFRDRCRHDRRGPFVVATVGAVLTVTGIWWSGLVVGLALGAVFAASGWNLWLVWHLRRGRSDEVGP